MNRMAVVGLVAVITTLGIIAYFISRDSDGTTSRMDVPVVEPGGTSVIVLVDFSKSFAIPRYGLRPEEHRALKAVAEAVAELATRYWTPPLKTVWMQIQTSSILAKPLCAPLETLQKLVKPAGSVGTREEIQAVLNRCVDTIVEASKNEKIWRTIPTSPGQSQWLLRLLRASTAREY
jgi:hypothetical protein